jgi:hypothetical protein
MTTEPLLFPEPERVSALSTAVEDDGVDVYVFQVLTGVWSRLTVDDGDMMRTDPALRYRRFNIDAVALHDRTVRHVTFYGLLDESVLIGLRATIDADVPRVPLSSVPF